VATGEWAPARAGVTTSISYGGRTTLVSQNAYSAYEPIPDIAERWELSDDNSKLTLHIRPGVKWHDGTPVTAKDAAHTLRYYLDPPQGYTSSPRIFLLPTIKDIIEVDNQTLVIELKQFPASFLPRFSGSSLTLLPAHLDLDTVSKTAMGTGPFKLGRFERDISAEWVRNPDYYLKDEQGRQLPFLDRIRAFQFTDQTLFLSAVRTGRVKHTDNGASAGIERGRHALRRDVPGIIIDEFIGGTFHTIFKNTPPFSDPRVREAIDLFIDRKLVVDIGFDGLAWPWDAGMQAVALGGQWALPSEEIMSRPGYRYLDSSGKLVTDPDEARSKWTELKKDPNDITRARQLLTAAGIRQGDLKFEVLNGTVTNTRTNPVFLSQMKELFGATWTPNFKPGQDGAEFLAGRFSVYTTASGYNVDEPGISMLPWLTGPGITGPIPAGWTEDDPSLTKLRELFAQQEFTFDVQKRRELIQEMQRTIIDWRGRIITNTSIGVSTWWPEYRGYPEVVTCCRGDVVHRYDRVWIAR
jgi:ABC-type transport system substrate-binding protein